MTYFCPADAARASAIAYPLPEIAGTRAMKCGVQS